MAEKFLWKVWCGWWKVEHHEAVAKAQVGQATRIARHVSKIVGRLVNFVPGADGSFLECAQLRQTTRFSGD